MKTVQIAGQSVRLQASQVIGKGGEADIYQLDPSRVLKLYKRSTDPDYANNQLAQAGAVKRINEQQSKLPAFPRGLPPEVVTPAELALSKSKIAGYTMPYITGMDTLMNFSNRAFRESSGIDANQVIGVFRELRRVVKLIHGSGVVIGDFNDLNVLTNNTTIKLVDADSMQFGGYMCQTYTNRFLDPLLASHGALELARPHNELSDWYAYAVMLMQSILYVGPYGGVHRPKTGKRLQHDERVLRRLTVFDSDVLYPKPALPLTTLPDEWQSYFQTITEQNTREIFPDRLLDDIRFTSCQQCGSVHGRSVCPGCQKPGVVRQKITIRGTVTASRVFQTKGKILQAAFHAGTLRYLYEEAGSLYRENSRQLVSTRLSPELRFRIQADQTLIGRGTALYIVTADGSSSRLNVEQYQGRLPVFGTNAKHSFWLQNGQLMRSSVHGPRYLGSVVSGQTLFWAGEHLGFGFYQAGSLVRGFMFTTDRPGLNDQVDLGVIRGQLVDATCVLSDTRGWFFTATQEDGVLKHRVRVLDAHGAVIATSMADAGDDSWLGRGIRGHMAIGSSLLVATDDGLQRITTHGDQVEVEREFPDTEPFMSAQTWLLPGPGGIYVISTHEITLLTIN